MQHRRSPAIESLELRTLYTAIPTATLNKGVLALYGTDAVDSVSVEASRTSFIVNFDGKSKSYRNGSVKLIRVFAGGGDDSILLSPKLLVRASIEGGAGNDRIGGGGLNDTIMGQAGNDTLAGNRGGDYLDGGAGDDLLEDTSFDFINVLHGGGGNDRAGFVFAYDNIHSGVESLYNLAPGVLYDDNSAVIDTVHGTTKLNVWWFAGDHDDVTVSGPDLDTSSNQYIVKRVTFVHGSVNDVNVIHTFDLTNALASGKAIIFTSVEDSVIGQQIPIYLPSKAR